MAIIKVGKKYILLKSKIGGHVFWTTSTGSYDSDAYELLFSSNSMEECIAAWQEAFLSSLFSSV